jgi:hypothetical protein
MPDRILDLDRERLSTGEFGERLAMHEDDQFADVSELITPSRWEHYGNTCTVHERSRPVPSGPRAAAKLSDHVGGPLPVLRYWRSRWFAAFSAGRAAFAWPV